METGSSAAATERSTDSAARGSYSPASGSGFVRQPFTGNVIPRARFDPAGANIAKYYPLPTGPGDNNSGINNFAASGSSVTDINQWDLKFDENIDVAVGPEIIPQHGAE